LLLVFSYKAKIGGGSDRTCRIINDFN